VSWICWCSFNDFIVFSRLDKQAAAVKAAEEEKAARLKEEAARAARQQGSESNFGKKKNL
jgi:hypothetical protein